MFSASICVICAICVLPFDTEMMHVLEPSTGKAAIPHAPRGHPARTDNPLFRDDRDSSLRSE